MMLFHAAPLVPDTTAFSRWSWRREDGPLREKLKAEGIPLIIDPLIETEHESFARFARDFDCVVANTIRSGAVVARCRTKTCRLPGGCMNRARWANIISGKYPKLRAAVPFADLLFAPSEQHRRQLIGVHRSAGEMFAQRHSGSWLRSGMKRRLPLAARSVFSFSAVSSREKARMFLWRRWRCSRRELQAGRAVSNRAGAFSIRIFGRRWKPWRSNGAKFLGPGRS